MAIREDVSAHVELTDDGAWCWFQDPRAARHVGDRDRTYAGWVTRGGDVELGAYDHDAGEATTATLHADFEEDDHDAPGIAFLPDGRVVAFYTAHGGPNVRYRVGETPEALSFGPERAFAPSGGHTYANPRWIGGRLFLFYRNDRGSLAYVVHEGTDAGDDPLPVDGWSDERELVTTGGREWCVYFKLDCVRGGAVEMGLTFAEGGRDEPHRHVHHARFDGDALAAADGSALGRAGAGTLPVEFRATPTVYDSGETGRDAWIWDCAAPRGAPQLVYAELPDPGEHRYRYARWTGDDWVDVPLADAGSYIVRDSDERYYSGGVALDGERAGVCYGSVGDHEGSVLRRYERAGTDGREGSADDGYWTTTTLAGDAVQNVRPVVPRNRHEDLPVLWMRGSYEHFRDERYDTAVVGPSGPASE